MSPLEPDDLPANLVPDPSNPRPSVAFTGYIGQSHTDGYVRFYLDEEMRDWFDVAEGDILHDRRGPGRSNIWVDQNATLQRHQAQPEDIQGEFLEGEMAARTVPQPAFHVALDVSDYIRTSPFKPHRPPDPDRAPENP